MICVHEQSLATAHTAGRQFGGIRRGGWVGWGGSGRKVVGQLDKCQSAVETLPLLLEASLGGASSLAPLVLLLFVRLEELHGVLLLLVLRSRLALRLHLGGSGRALLASMPVPVSKNEKGVELPREQKTARDIPNGEQMFSVPYFASHSATALLSTDWALPWPSFGSSLFRREKGCLGQ